VSLTAETVLPFASGDTAQIVFYSEGVGTDPGGKWLGGIFGVGLTRILADAYRHLIFNYNPGDEIFVFGFSRGAFTARSFVGFISNCGILDQRFAGKADEQLDNYRRRDNSRRYLEQMREYRLTYCTKTCVSPEEDGWRAQTLPDYQPGDAPLIAIGYVGVWDTVGELGIPKWALLSRWINRGYRFHDLDLSGIVRSARHAVAIDEARVDYQPTLWRNLDDLNAAAGFAGADADAPFQQKWFPGVHGSVGGGGVRRGLSDNTLDWIWDGARRAGLVFDTSRLSRVYELRPSPLENLENSTDRDWIGRLQFRAPRHPGPRHLDDVGIIARQRWKAPPNLLPEGADYRPATLSHVARPLDALPAEDFSEQADGDFDLYTVAQGDTLSAIARRFYGNAAKWQTIFAANRSKLADPDHIYVGQSLRVPHLPTDADREATGGS